MYYEGNLNFYKIDVKWFTLRRMNDLQSLVFKWNENNGNVQLVVRGLSVDIDLDAAVKVAWIVPEVTIRQLKV